MWKLIGFLGLSVILLGLGGLIAWSAKYIQNETEASYEPENEQEEKKLKIWDQALHGLLIAGLAIAGITATADVVVFVGKLLDLAINILFL